MKTITYDGFIKLNPCRVKTKSRNKMKTETKRNISACISVVSLLSMCAFINANSIATVFYGTAISLIIFVVSAYKAGAFRQC